MDRCLSTDVQELVDAIVQTFTLPPAARDWQHRQEILVARTLFVRGTLESGRAQVTATELTQRIRQVDADPTLAVTYAIADEEGR